MNPPITFKRLLLCNPNLLLIGIFAVSVVGVATFSVSSEATHTVRPQLETNTDQPRVDKDFGAVPLSFEMNGGQTDKRVRFIARGRGYGVFLTPDEGDHAVQLTANRTGNTSTAGSVDYETADATASERTDYVASFGRLHFAPGETSKTFKVLLTDDVLIDGDRSFTVTLMNGSGVTVSLNGAKTTVIIVDDDVTQAPTNPNEDSRTFVRQQ